MLDNTDRGTQVTSGSFYVENGNGTVEDYDKKSRLIIFDGFEIQFPKHRPNAWRRLWYRFFLGWRWEKI